MSARVKRNALLVAVSVALVCGAVTASVQGQQPAPAPSALIPSLLEPGEGLAVRETSPKTGLVTFAVTPGRGLILPGMATASAVDRALVFVDSYGLAFGLQDRQNVVPLRAAEVDVLGQEHVRLRQLYQGIPVTAGELVVHLRGDRVIAANGHALSDFPPSVIPEVAAGAAQDQAQALVQKNKPDQAGGARYSEPRLEVFNRGMLDEGTHPSRLAWFIEASGESLREYIWLDAQTGGILLTFSQLAQAKNRTVHDLNHGTALPGPIARTEGQPPSVDADVNQAYDFSGITYDYYSTNHGRDSFDGAGALLRSSVHYGTNYANASWNGTQMYYGDGFASADDIVAHELTHAVTEYSANLFYYNQSGALNESYSDVLGETVDLVDGVGTDTAGVRWRIGEDLPIGAFRDMMTPTAFGHPGKMSDSAEFFCSSRAWVHPDHDRGGVHVNSGIPNHAYALMVDGGTYNGRTITGIGTTKAAKIQYRALTTYLTSGSGFADNASALNQSCTDLIGTVGITSADCSQVANAIVAVEMANPWACTGATPPPVTFCPTGGSPVPVFAEGFETGLSAWTATSTTATEWVVGNSFVAKGLRSAFGADISGASDHWLAMTNPVTVPAGGRLYFDHAFEFEHGWDGVSFHYWDAGVLEYSTNGTTWTDAGSLIDAGQRYNGSISPLGVQNPLGTRAGFVGSSFGYTGSRLNLASLAGQNVRFRFRVGTDWIFGSLGWHVDNVQVYACSAPGTSPTAAADTFSTPHNTALNVPSPGVLANDNSNGGGPMTAVQITTPSSGTVVLNSDGSFTYTPVNGFSGAATFSYRASTINGQSSVATVTVNVAAPAPPGFSQQPTNMTVFVGQAARFSVSLTGSPIPACLWQLSTNFGASWTSLSNSPPYSGVTTTQLTVSNATLAMSATQYRCLATNSQSSLASNGATLSVAATVPAGTPTSGGWTGATDQSRYYNFTVSGGTSISRLSFQVAATGCGQTISTDVTGSIPIVNSAFSFSTSSACEQKQTSGRFTSPTSASGTVTVIFNSGPTCTCVGTRVQNWNAVSPSAGPQFLLHPANQSPSPGQNAQFTVAASGSPAPTFLWEMSTNGGGSWGNVPAISPYSGGATPTLTILGSGLSGLNGAQFRARAQNASGPATSNAATIVSTGPVPPTSVNDSYWVLEDTPLNMAAPGVLGNDNTNGGGAMTAAVVTVPLNGRLTLAADGGFTYTPNAGFLGTDSFTYRARNSAGPGNVATVILRLVVVDGPADPPTNLRVVSMAGNTVTFAWNPPTSGMRPTGFQIEGGLVSGQVLGSLPLGLVPAVTVTLPTGSFYLRVRTLGGFGPSRPSNELLTYVNVPVPPSAPKNLLGLVVGNTLNLAWTPTFGGGAPTNVTLDVAGPVSGSAPLGPTDTFSFAGVPAGTYTLSVRAVNASGSSASSTPVTLTFPTACSGAPQPVANFLAYKAGGSLFLNWEPPATGTAPTSYLLNVTGAYVGSIPTSLRALSGAVPAGTYHFSVVARNACGDSAPTAVQTVSLP